MKFCKNVDIRNPKETGHTYLFVSNIVYCKQQQIAQGNT